jgi:CDP-glucose 4,6-dehydratase
MRHIEGDVTDFSSLERAMQQARPDFVFHLAAQPLVRRSYVEPRRTFDVNVMGTVNVLDLVRNSDTVQTCVVVTSDKCYENREWERGYRETDAMGGYDPYSASKGCSELVVSSYRRAFLQGTGNKIKIASARAGNVIGGGDWSADRIVTDFVSSILADKALTLRNPKATRPWQHVLEPLSGYLHLAAMLSKKHGERYAQGWNFGPHDSSVIPVVDLAKMLCEKWGRGEVNVQVNPLQVHEAGLLKLDSTKAHVQLGWSPVWNVDAAVQATVEWYRGYSQGLTAQQLTNSQLDSYCAAALAQRCVWTLAEENATTWTNNNYDKKSSTLLAG